MRGMDCPQCESELVTYHYRDHEASVCESCGYVGIFADHKGEPIQVESWHEALRRFRDRERGDSTAE